MHSPFPAVISVILPSDVIDRAMLPTLKTVVLYCIVCHMNLRSREDCTRFGIKFSGQPMRRVGGSVGRFGSCQVESHVYRIKL